ncbi:hypothetical protein PAPYR_7647 [Paratrimastix pyriformis]|uniref:Uncharacterized protein n=1 Tax=Paratrimastix pyriformis TaxID=342808 RepID=A0ABQ8UGJ6_9EUKA|nr:hypothetical protein PAPYR_7647 [Paratrimastix pyriformis]
MHLSPDLRLSPILDPRCYFSAVSPPYITTPHHPTVPYTRSTPGYCITGVVTVQNFGLKSFKIPFRASFPPKPAGTRSDTRAHPGTGARLCIRQSSATRGQGRAQPSPARPHRGGASGLETRPFDDILRKNLAQVIRRSSARARKVY